MKFNAKKICVWRDLSSKHLIPLLERIPTPAPPLQRELFTPKVILSRGYPKQKSLSISQSQGYLFLKFYCYSLQVNLTRNRGEALPVCACWRGRLLCNAQLFS